MTGTAFNIAAATPEELGRKVLDEVCSSSPDLWNLSHYLAEKVDLEQRDAEGRTPLLAATMAGFTDAARMLIAAGANVSATNKSGDAPLVIAVVAKNLPVIKDLVTVGAPGPATGSSRGSDMWDGLMDSLMKDIAEMEAAKTTIGVFRPLTFKARK